MYTPNHFKPKDAVETWNLIDQYPFATLLAETSEGPFVSHLPMISARSDGATPKVLGHMSRSNQQWKHFQNNSRALAIFHGPHAYVTPRWYAEHDVPTWNYAVVHAHGRIRLLEEPRDLVLILRRLSDRFEVGPDAWRFGLPSDLKQDGALAAAIIGFELEIERLEPKFKIGQNRSQLDRNGVRSGLMERGDEGSKGVVELMRKFDV